MSRICQLTAKKPLKGHHVSHSNRKTNRYFYPNLQTKRIFVPEIGKWVVLKLASSTLRTLNKVGAYQYFKEQITKGFDPQVWFEEKEASAVKQERGYRRVETIDKNGNKTYSITYEPEGKNQRKVKLSSLIK
jgi:large subunit ribosomal protein L28